MVGNEEIKQVTLKHCLDSLKNNVAEEDVEQIVKLVTTVHDERMDEQEDNDENDEVSKEELDEVISKIEKKKKKSYDFLTRAGETFKESIFKLCRRLIKVL